MALRPPAVARHAEAAEGEAAVQLGRAAVAVAGPDSCWLRTPVETRGEDLTTIADFVVEPGDRMPFVLTWQESHIPAPRAIHADHALRDTREYWANWLAQCT